MSSTVEGLLACGRGPITPLQMLPSRAQTVDVACKNHVYLQASHGSEVQAFRTGGLRLQLKEHGSHHVGCHGILAPQF